MAGIIGVASNLRTGTNPPFLLSDFQAMYPQFTATVIPNLMTNMYINLANASISQARWRDSWQIAMGLFVAHFCSLYVMGNAAAGSNAATVLAKGKARGLNTSESVGDVSVSVDYSSIAGDLDGWAAWKLTVYGIQLATMGRLVGKGNMYIY